MPQLRKQLRHSLAQVTVAAALAAATVVAVPAMATEERILNLFNWSDFIADDTIKNFEKETGIKVHLDTYDSNEILHAKLSLKSTGYDIVIPAAHWGNMQIQAGLLRKVDKVKLPNLANLDPAIESQLAKLDPGNQYLVPWLWGYTTVGINTAKVKAALGNLPMPANPWDLVFDVKYVSKLKSCGVSFLDAPSDILPAALAYIGKDPFSTNKADYAEAGQMLAKVRPYITLFSTLSYVADMTNGSLCAAIAWSGDMNLARRDAIEAKNGNNIVALIPKTGGVLFFDTMAIPSDAPHPENAHLWMNYIMRPEVQANLTNKVRYANPNAASRKFVLKELAQDKSIFLTDDDMKNMVAPKVMSVDLRRIATRVFVQFKSGN
ncbi:extracellular solute-binding protein [Undibacterium rugosum]|uniref:Putrescine-binding periplasmic protein n=1 Tax=Undibacterium rugosum TaxID=2762291 RepID=A0A923I4H4_9BURK|nr:extracellular solute-binding protein [Undibacterium rugosum]MBR7779298.1 extracellular solute-binding protein [Undibacterium rugosum]